MIARALYLVAAWFTVSMVVTLMLGTRLRRAHFALSVLWLAAVLAVGDIWALRTFGRPPEVIALTGLAAVLGVGCIVWLCDWNAFGQVAWLTTIIVTPLFLVYAYSVIIDAHLAPASFLAAQMFLYIQSVAALVALTQMYENLDVNCRVRWRNRIDRIQPAPGFTPMVSLHLPTYDEPPEVVEGTLLALAALDYPAFEVLVVDNNTPEEM
ncbi:MAG: hypothetical protein ABSA10_10695, partial [Anaerolineales bacterium]